MAYWIARMCEEFDCLPTEALREWRRAPDGLIAQVMEARAFAAAYQMYDSATDKSDLPQSPLIDLIVEIEQEERTRQIEERRRGGT